ncbi:MAG: ChbG/HpnK family deacetylase [Bacteroidales bacterium]
MENTSYLLLRLDDAGMCHSVNAAIKKFIEVGLPFSSSIMPPCGWFQEAVDMFKQYPDISIGVHLTLNSEWHTYKWGPVLGRETVPSLVDDNGYFYISQEKLINNNPDMKEIENECRAQIEKVIQAGLQVDYLDSHLNILKSSPELKKLWVKLANDYNLGISGGYGEEIIDLFFVPHKYKKYKLIDRIQDFNPGKYYYDSFHVGFDNPELQALSDMHMKEVGIEYEVSKHRQAELEALCSVEFMEAIDSNKVRLITYREFISRKGIKNIKV